MSFNVILHTYGIIWIRSFLRSLLETIQVSDILIMYIVGNIRTFFIEEYNNIVLNFCNMLHSVIILY